MQKENEMSAIRMNQREPSKHAAIAKLWQSIWPKPILNNFHGRSHIPLHPDWLPVPGKWQFSPRKNVQHRRIDTYPHSWAVLLFKGCALQSQIRHVEKSINWVVIHQQWIHNALDAVCPQSRFSLQRSHIKHHTPRSHMCLCWFVWNPQVRIRNSISIMSFSNQHSGVPTGDISTEYERTPLAGTIEVDTYLVSPTRARHKGQIEIDMWVILLTQAMRLGSSREWSMAFCPVTSSRSTTPKAYTSLAVVSWCLKKYCGSKYLHGSCPFPSILVAEEERKSDHWATTLTGIRRL